MRKVSSRGGRTVVAISGKHAVALAFRWPEDEHEGLLGFAVRRTDPTRDDSWLKTVLRFQGEPIEKGTLYDSSEAPIQSFVWCDYGLEDEKSLGLPAGSRFVYEVIPVRGKAGALELKEDEAVHIAVSTEPERDHGPNEPEAHFNRGLSQMQEYERLFGEGHEPNDDPVALNWLARDLDETVVAYVNRAVDDESLHLDVAAYHLDHPAVIEAICKLGSRARVSMDWGSTEKTTPKNQGPNGPAFETLTAAGVFVHQREHVAISHNKYMVLKKSDGTPLSVLTGSTNFTVGGIATQSNQSVIAHNEELAQVYLEDFERVLQNDNDSLRDFNQKGTVIDDTLEVYFSPHHSEQRPDLDRLTDLAQAATSNRLFMTFRMTDRPLIDAMLDDNVPVFGVADRVYRGKKETSGDRALFLEAHTADPRVVACNFPLDDEPEEDVLLDELKRGEIEPIVHHKLLVLDWDTPNCVVATGSANYSANSTAHNDENTLVIHGDRRLAEEYFVEFCRLFTHWRPRWLREREHEGAGGPEHLASDSSWTDGWAKGRRLAQFLDVATSGATAAAESDRVGAEAGQPAPKPKAAAKEAAVSEAGQRIDHIVVLMLENRSFDHMLGLLPGVEGVALDAEGKDPNHFNYADPQKPTDDEQYFVRKAKYFSIPEGDIPPPTYDPKNKRWSMYGGPSHSFPSANEQLFNDKWGPTGRDAKGNMPEFGSGYVKSYIDELNQTYEAWQKMDAEFKKPDSPPRDHVGVAMSAFSPDQVPVISGLAQEFAVCDHWFSEVPGPTEPNRLFMHAATSVGLVHNPWEFPIEARTIYEDLDEAPGRTWAFYYYDLADANNFPALKKRVEQIRPASQFTTDLQDPATFPNYVFLCPKYWNTEEGHANSQHAPYDVRYGEHWIADVYEALRNSDLWEKTLLIITYDEHGGFFDHVKPPDEGVLPPDGFVSPTAYDKTHYGYMFFNGRPKEEYTFHFDRLGCRVPAVLVSPWIKKGTIVSDRLQHTSVLATVRKMWGLRDRPLTAREGQAKRFDHLLEALESPRDDCPATLKRPPLPKVSLSAAADQPLSPVQWEIFHQVNHLDGHEDSGKPAPPPKTQGEAAKYIQERTRAHRQFHKARKANGRFTVYQDKRGEFRWRLSDANGVIIAASSDGFSTRATAEKEIAQVRELAGDAGLDEPDAK